MTRAPIDALTPRGPGHQFVLYGDSCSGVPGAPHEATHAAVNAVVRRLSPPPEFIVFPGDEIIGLTGDAAALRAQWRHWLETEMAWLDRAAIPLYNATGNHTAYDPMSERVFAEALAHLPRNGPPGQEGLAYAVRRGDLLMVFVHTLASGLGGEGHVETAWLEATLEAHAEARWKFVIGHHPAFPVNGFAGDYARTLGPEHVGPFWRILRAQGVIAYLCSHILAYDVQVHEGVLQITTAGAGTAHRMPEGVEYLHAVQAAVDDAGLRCQVLDTVGRVRERLVWPLPAVAPRAWTRLASGPQPAPLTGRCDAAREPPVICHWRLAGRTNAGATGRRQTLIAAAPEGGPAALWLGLAGADQRLTLTLQPEPGRSPHYWFGPALGADAAFDIEVAVHTGMGPGGILVREAGSAAPWTSMTSASPWGAERLDWPPVWQVGAGPGPDLDFAGPALTVDCALPNP